MISEVVVPCFVPVAGGSSIKVILPGFATDDGVPHSWDTYVHYFGNMLLSTGRNIEEEIGNADPLPVNEKAPVLAVHEVSK